ncbi:hypothetical protein COEREDRAFT_7124 [Coemansia reversa NRRL 1564]|uniref:Uncharacterized protein n=1 Tax=Coemansia reversa (strain ATCC 12441 / NRRL 1564) TaxID=763665 RepID=A0A2G5BFZ8_COERN|nr:hypothetical protein COEREDRAFT_7124 [Coemansia reversa NRRL 1564]|eukprot:PIA17944.1 hypothetical protein COEREDRAFT_7124 [Coemansia reversa NRRL 1564]
MQALASTAAPSPHAVNNALHILRAPPLQSQKIKAYSRTCSAAATTATSKVDTKPYPVVSNIQASARQSSIMLHRAAPRNPLAGNALLPLGKEGETRQFPLIADMAVASPDPYHTQASNQHAAASYCGHDLLQILSAI